MDFLLSVSLKFCCSFLQPIVVRAVFVSSLILLACVWDVSLHFQCCVTDMYCDIMDFTQAIFLCTLLGNKWKVIFFFFRSIIKKLVHYGFLSLKFRVNCHRCFIQDEFKVLVYMYVFFLRCALLTLWPRNWTFK